MSRKKSERRGRPRTGTGPDVDHAELERLLVHGEFTTSSDGVVEHRYLSFRELADRFGISFTLVQRFARRHNCLERRAGSGAEPPPTLAPAATIAASESSAADAPTTAAPTTQAMLPTIREIFVTWVRAVQAGEIRIASAGEIEKMMKIAADLDAEAQMRALIPAGVPTLEELQDLHERLLREYEATTPAERGELDLIGLAERAAEGAAAEASEPDPAE
jgi:hypothetical protein